MLGAAVTWNISNVGAIAGLMGASYGVSLAAVGLLTTGALRHPSRGADPRRAPDRPRRRPARRARLARRRRGGKRPCAARPVARARARRTGADGPRHRRGLRRRHRPRPLGEGRPLLAGRLRRRHDGRRRARADGRAAARRRASAGARPYWTGLVLALLGVLPVLAARPTGEHSTPSCPRPGGRA